MLDYFGNWIEKVTYTVYYMCIIFFFLHVCVCFLFFAACILTSFIICQKYRNFCLLFVAFAYFLLSSPLFFTISFSFWRNGIPLGNGRIDIHDLSEALKDIQLSQQYAEKFLRQSDKTNSGDVELAEFIHYVREHEKNLQLHFRHLDRDGDGRVNVDDLIAGFRELGIEIDVDEALTLLKRIDQDDTLFINYDEWRDFLLWAPSTDLHGIIKFWRHSTYLDVGEDINVPDDFTANELETGKWWRHLAAGGIAGMFSRTCTAPLDRIKVFLQVQTTRTRISDSFNYLLREGGVRSFWRGNGTNVLKIAPESAIKFAAYEQVKQLIRQNENRQLSIFERYVCSFVFVYIFSAVKIT